jgi:hypothetical protein
VKQSRLPGLPSCCCSPVLFVPWSRGFGLQRLRLICADVPELDQVAPLVLELHTSPVPAA